MKKSIVPEEIKDEMDLRGENLAAGYFREFGRMVIQDTIERGIKNPHMVIAGDCRSDTQEIMSFLEQGVIESGGAVLYAGVNVPKTIAYFAGEKFQSDLVGYITASHLKAGSNGIKFNRYYRDRNLDLKSPLKKDVSQEIRAAYIEYFKGKFGKFGKEKEILIDALYGTSAGIAREIFENAGFKVHSLRDVVDPNFSGLPTQSPDPYERENLRDLINLAQEKNTYGFAFDGDVDRVGIVAESGEILEGDEIIMLLADYHIRNAKEKGIEFPKFVYELKCSNCVPQAVIDAGGIPIIEKTGWQNIKKKMVEDGAVAGGEISGHNFARDFCVPNGDDGIFNAMILASIVENSKSEIVKQTKKTLVELKHREFYNSSGYDKQKEKDGKRRFTKYYTSPELRVRHNKEANNELIKKLKTDIGKKDRYVVRDIGGDTRIEYYGEQGDVNKFDDWKSWIVARGSKTEPGMITIRFEGKTLFDMAKIEGSLMAEAKKVDKSLEHKAKKVDESLEHKISQALESASPKILRDNPREPLVFIE